MPRPLNDTASDYYVTGSAARGYTLRRWEHEDCAIPGWGSVASVSLGTYPTRSEAWLAAAEIAGAADHAEALAPADA